MWDWSTQGRDWWFCTPTWCRIRGLEHLRSHYGSGRLHFLQYPRPGSWYLYGEYSGELATLTLPKIPPVPTDKSTEKTSQFRLVSDSTESPNDLPLSGGSGSRCPDTVSFPNWQDTTPFQSNSFVNFFRQIQILHLGIRYTILPVTKLVSSSKDPRLHHVMGVLDLKPPAPPHPSARATETVLRVSFNTQFQDQDIPGNSIRDAISQYSASLQDQSMVPDIPFLSLRASSEEISVSINTQDQDPDDPHDVQNPQCPPHDLFPSSTHFSQVILSLSTKLHILPLLLPIVSQDNEYLPPSHIQKTPNQSF